jgi:GNAT-family acetyltransferase (TIGR03103 family)
MEFLKQHGQVVVKPAQGEQGQGVSVGLSSPEDVELALERARQLSGRVLMEAYVDGRDLRIIVIDGKVVAAALRLPPTVSGDGRHTIEELIEKQSRRRAAATDGESRIPLDEETRRCIRDAGYEPGDVLPADRMLTVRRTANLHAGGTIHDVTADLNPTLEQAAVEAARALEIPVVGLDFMVPDPAGEDYVIIEANERPGLANHEPQPTVERFIDFLFPMTIGNRNV